MSTYEVRWISERGFANEGDYVYGLPEAINAEVAAYTSSDPKEFTSSTHKTFEAARLAAIKAARKSRKEYHEHETVAIGVHEAGKEQTQEDWEAVKYGINA